MASQDLTISCSAFSCLSVLALRTSHSSLSVCSCQYTATLQVVHKDITYRARMACQTSHRPLAGCCLTVRRVSSVSKGLVLQLPGHVPTLGVL